MRATPLITPKPNVLPTPQVKTNIVKQTVDLKPAGNTVAIKTISDNPFEGGSAVSVVTQASGGMSPAPSSMQSKGILHSFMPGLGETKTAEKTAGEGGSVFNSIISAGSNIATKHFDSRIAQEEARVAASQAAAAKAQAEADIERSRTDRLLSSAYRSTTASVGGFKFNWGLVALGAVGLGAAYMLSKKKGKGKRRR